MSKIRVAVAGVGSCSSALIQGIQWYLDHPEETIGLMYEEIGGYKVTDLEFVAGFDIDSRKVGSYLRDAIFEKPNRNMRHVNNISESVIPAGAIVYKGPVLDGVAPHMEDYPEDVTFKVDEETKPVADYTYIQILKALNVDVLLNYMPVGSEEASKFYIENAIKAGVSVVNCMPSYISTEDSKKLEALAIQNKVTIVGSDMRSAYGASRLSEVIQGSMLDSGLLVTQHIQTNMAAGSTQGEYDIRCGRTANTDFLNMAVQNRLKNKHISKENVLSGQNTVREKGVEGATMFAGPSLTVMQKPGGKYIGTDNKVANFDIVAYGWAGARYELTARLSVQDSPNSGGIVADAIRFCKVARELTVVGYLRGPSAWTQKTPPIQMKTSDAKFECDALARRIVTSSLEKQLEKNDPKPDDLDWTFQKSVTDYE